MSNMAPRVRIEEIRLENFRAFDNARLTLSDLTFLIGKNGAGKSSLLDAVEFMREAVADSLPNALDRREGLARIRRVGAPVDARVGVAIVMRVPIGTRMVRALYGFEVSDVDGGMEINEKLSFPDFDPVPGAAQDQPQRKMTGFSRGPGGFQIDANLAPGDVADRLSFPLISGANAHWDAVWKALRSMRTYNLSPHVMAMPALIGNRTSLDRYGSNISDVVHDLVARPKVHQWVVGFLDAITEGIVDVRVSPDSGYRKLQFTQQTTTGVRHVMTVKEVSQGTLRALGVLAALHQRLEPLGTDPTLVMIDEIEDSIHPHALSALVEAAGISTERFPIVLTTHSPEVLGLPQVDVDGVRIVQWKGGTSRIYTLGEATKAGVDRINTVGELLRYNALWPSDMPEAFTGEFLEA